ncbi:MAG TPA: XTP/dITP diphosphatase [Desulfobacteraceae bacterium]|nr:XTP/dITP diphosphatase [Desulfobacteraceae bacterium]HPJ68657.1 XTP/dITP diphosphatase [Desulfobacteraceae bacterium]HPQ29489.1 XTP/dITP diphosphatase [Desulfobacteraceae bacterium]
MNSDKIILKNPIVLATRNRGKISEFKEILENFDIDIKGLNEFFPIPPVEEDGKTFEENAVKKACYTSRILGLPAIADDSGLSVEALGGLPGVFSARYAGRQATDLENNIKLLDAMKGVENRAAAFECIIAIAVPKGLSLIYAGRCEGLITNELTGGKGFGYDPIFYYVPGKKTFAQMTLEEKNKVSHRGRAMLRLKSEFGNILKWLNENLNE